METTATKATSAPTPTRLSTANRFLIAQITDLAIDISLAGTYTVIVSLHPSCWNYSVIVYPAGKRATDAIYHGDASLQIDDSKDSTAAVNALPAMLHKLEALLKEGAPS